MREATCGHANRLERPTAAGSGIETNSSGENDSVNAVVGVFVKEPEVGIDSDTFIRFGLWRCVLQYRVARRAQNGQRGVCDNYRQAAPGSALYCAFASLSMKNLINHSALEG